MNKQAPEPREGSAPVGEEVAEVKPTPPPMSLFKALARARSEFPIIPRNRTATVPMKNGGKYSFTYADLSDVFEATTPVLSAYGLSVFQTPSGNSLETVVAHESGETITGTWPIKPMPHNNLDTSQSYQAAVQVAKRYALTAMLGITTEESIEGDPRAQKKRLPDPVKETFETPNGIRMPKGAKYEKGASKREMAEAAARAIEGQFDEVKTQVGLNGVWNRNEEFIDMLKERQSDLFDSIYDKFHLLMSTFEEPEEEEAK